MSKLFGQLHFYYVLSLPKIVLWWNFQFIRVRVVQINGAGTAKKKLKMEVDRLLNRHFCSIETIQLKYHILIAIRSVDGPSSVSAWLPKAPKNWFKDPGTNPKSKILIFALSSCRMSQMKDCTFLSKPGQTNLKKNRFYSSRPKPVRGLTILKILEKKWIDITTRLLRGVTSNLRD